MSILLLDFPAPAIFTGQEPVASRMLVIFALAESKRSLLPPSRSEMEARFMASLIGPASVKSP